MDNTELQTILLILLIIIVSFGLIAIFYFIFSFRRFGKVLKKVDYFMEDITYKAEQLGVTVDSINKLSKLIDISDAFLKSNYRKLLRVIIDNKSFLEKFLKEIADTEIARGVTSKNDLKDIYKKGKKIVDDELKKENKSKRTTKSKVTKSVETKTKVASSKTSKSTKASTSKKKAIPNKKKTITKSKPSIKDGKK